MSVERILASLIIGVFQGLATTIIIFRQLENINIAKKM